MAVLSPEAYSEVNGTDGLLFFASAIRGAAVKPVLPVTPGSPSPVDALDRDFDVLFTAETHNFPCAVSSNLCLSVLVGWSHVWLKM